MTNQKHSAAYKIFHYYYNCLIPQHHLYTEEYVNTFGIPTTGNRDIDRNLAESAIEARMTISEMAQYVDDGATLEFLQPEKTAEIYEIIVEHLNNWRYKVDSSYQEVDVPIEDLKKLDYLAEQIFIIARNYMSDLTSTSGLLRNLDKLSSGRFNRKAKTPQQEAQQQKQRSTATHKPIVELIEKTTFSRSNQWR